MGLTPTDNNVHLVPYERPEETEGGILIPDSARYDDSGLLYEVVAVGPGKRTPKGVRIPCEVRVGDIVELESKWVAQLLPIDITDGEIYTVPEDLISHIWPVEE